LKIAFRTNRSNLRFILCLELLARFSIVACTAALWLATSVWAQDSCMVSKATPVCLDIPEAGQSTVSGRATRGSVEVTVNGGTPYRNREVVDHKFIVDVGPLAPDIEIVAKKSGNSAYQARVIVGGHGQCPTDSAHPCIQKPIIGEASVTIKAGAAGLSNGATLGLNRGKPGEEILTISPAGTAANATVKVKTRNLSGHDWIDISDPPNPPTLLAGPLHPQAKTVANCSETEGAKPCLNPVKTTDKAVTGFATKSSTIKIELDNTEKGRVIANASTGEFSLDLSSHTKGQTITATQIDPAPGANVKPATTVVKEPPAADSTFALYTLGLVGVNVAGASDTGPSQQYFVSFDTRLPLPILGPRLCGDPDADFKMDYKCWLWFNPRIASAPAPASSTLKSFSSVNSLSSGLSGETLGQITQTVEVHSGAEFSLFHGPRVPTSTTVAFKGGLAAIIGGGIVTPINPTSNASIFVLNNNLGNQFTENALGGGTRTFAQTYPILASALCGTGTGRYGFTSNPPCTPSASTYSNVAFVLPNRSRFYRDYFVGLRLRTYFFSGDCTHKVDKAAEPVSTSCKAANIYPGTFDVRLGQDETVTGGYLRRLVLTSTASYPLPGTSGAVRIFGSTYVSMNRNRNMPALALLAASSTIPITDPTVVIQPIKPSDHDYFRLGVGVDLVPLISKWISPPKTTTDKGTPAAAPAAATP
jgi:hypothetical protein